MNGQSDSVVSQYFGPSTTIQTAEMHLTYQYLLAAANLSIGRLWFDDEASYEKLDTHSVFV